MDKEQIINNGFEILATYFTNVYAFALPQSIKVVESPNVRKLFRRELRNKIESYRDAFCHKDNEKYYVSILVDIVKFFNQFGTGELINEIDFVKIMCEEMVTKSALKTLNLGQKKALFKRFICESVVKFTAHVSYELDDLIQYKVAEFLTDEMKQDERNLAELWKSKLIEILGKVRDEIYNQFMSLDSGVNPSTVASNGNHRAALKSMVRKMRELLAANAQLRRYVAQQDSQISELKKKLHRNTLSQSMSMEKSREIETLRESLNSEIEKSKSMESEIDVLKSKLKDSQNNSLLEIQIENLKAENEDLRKTLDELPLPNDSVN